MISQNEVTLIIVWTFSWVAIAIMAVRILWQRIQMRKLTLGDYLTMGAIFCAIARLAIIDVVLVWGTNNVPATFRKTHHFTPTELYQREIGSKLALVNRIFYNSYIWLQKLVLLAFYRGILRNLRWEKMVMKIYLAFFFGSYVVVQVITFTECDPFNHYWQVLPAPGTCTEAQVQLITLGVLSIITDVMLIVMPIPVIIKWQRSWKEKIQLYALFLFGLFIVAITVVRLPQNWNNATAQVNRTTWASAELLSAAIVANAPTFYSLNKRRGQQSSSKPLGSDPSDQYPSSSYPASHSKSRSVAHTRTQDDEFQLMSYNGDVKA